MDEQGAQNLLRWSPLSANDQLAHPASVGRRRARPRRQRHRPAGTTRRARAAVASELLNVTDGGFVAAPKPAPRGRGRRGSDGGVRQQRDARVSSMRALYGLGGEGGGGGDPAGPPAAADLRPPSRDLRPSAPERPRRRAALQLRRERSAGRPRDLGAEDERRARRPLRTRAPAAAAAAGLGAVAPMYATSPQASQSGRRARWVGSTTIGRTRSTTCSSSRRGSTPTCCSGGRVARPASVAHG